MSSSALPTLLPITHVTLYTSGVGYFERGGDVEGDTRLTLFFPVGQVNDVLKSLVLLDGGGGTLQPVTYAAQDPVKKALQAFSIDVSDNPDRPTLLNRMRGTSVTLTTDDPAPLTGVILGVETQSVLRDDSLTETYRLSLLAGDALHTIPLDTIRSLTINDTALADELRQALLTVAQGRDATRRPVTLTFTGEGTRPVRIGYLTEAPAWQTSYRLVLGETPRLQGWALVQNTGQDDWTDAHLTLVSGRPISFIQDLYTPLYVHRPTVQPRILASPTPQTYAGSLMDDERAYSMDAGPEEYVGGAVMAGLASSPVPAPRGSIPRARKAAMTTDFMEQAAEQSVASTGAQLGTALFAYGIDVPVSVPRQQSAMIPFLAGEVGAERVSVYNEDVQSDHPLSGVRLKNTTALHLMGGPLTVFEAQGDAGSGYVGDALMDDTEPGRTRLLTYAIDLAVDGESRTDRQSGSITSMTVAQGLLKISRKVRNVTHYTFKNNGTAPRTIIIEHPQRESQWKLLEPETPGERTATHYRFDVAVAPSASVTFTVREERSFVDSLSLVSEGLEKLTVYATLVEALAPVRAALTEVAARRRRLAEIEARVAETEHQLQAITKGQERIRKNMEALDHKSDLYRRYVGELDKQETQIGGLVAQNEARQGELAQARAELGAYVGGLDLG